MSNISEYNYIADICFA